MLTLVSWLLDSTCAIHNCRYHHKRLDLLNLLIAVKGRDVGRAYSLLCKVKMLHKPSYDCHRHPFGHVRCVHLGNPGLHYAAKTPIGMTKSAPE
jgi:hypothetical protein